MPYRLAELTLSADCDVARLKKQLSNGELFDPVQHSKGLCSWVYGQVYGGGSDEHYGIFHALDASTTQRLWELIIESRNEYTYPVSRF